MQVPVRETEWKHIALVRQMLSLLSALLHSYSGADITMSSSWCVGVYMCGCMYMCLCGSMSGLPIFIHADDVSK